MKFPWRKRIKLTIDDEFLEYLVKELLNDSHSWEHSSYFQHLEIKKNLVNPAVVRLNIFGWLKRRV